MQIRVANRQDEKNIQSIFGDLCSKKGEELDLSSKHKDLRNIEANYFGNEGIFLVAEDDGKLIGFAGAKKESDTAISVDRFYIDDAHKRSGIDKQFMQVIVPFAKRMYFERLNWNVMEEPPKIGVSANQAQTSQTYSAPSCFNKALLVQMRFKKDENNRYWLAIESANSSAN